MLMKMVQHRRNSLQKQFEVEMIINGKRDCSKVNKQWEYKYNGCKLYSSLIVFNCSFYSSKLLSKYVKLTMLILYYSTENLGISQSISKCSRNEKRSK